jgi:CBS domain-containing protein|tara:strand:+ start:60 stop:485 length:426 start_codon:yes stop_codon:yes gene_type:complete
MTVKEIMHESTVLESNMSILDASKIMKEKDIGSILIKVNDSDYGIVTERDILYKVIARELDPKTTPIKDIMTSLIYTIDSNDSIQKASEIFNIHHIRRLPVMEKDKLIGMITTRDVAKRCVFRFYKRMYEHSRDESNKGWR